MSATIFSKLEEKKGSHVLIHLQVKLVWTDDLRNSRPSADAARVGVLQKLIKLSSKPIFNID